MSSSLLPLIIGTLRNPSRNVLDGPMEPRLVLSARQGISYDFLIRFATLIVT